MNAPKLLGGRIALGHRQVSLTCVCIVSEEAVSCPVILCSLCILFLMVGSFYCFMLRSIFPVYTWSLVLFSVAIKCD